MCERAHNVRRSPYANQGLLVLAMSERETTGKDTAEALRNMERANRAMARIFNMEEKEDD